MNVRTRVVSLLIVAGAALSVTACGGGDADGGQPLTISSYRGADWITDGTVKPPTSTGRGERIRYPHSMDGAVMAAADSQTLLDTAPDDAFGAVARDYFAPGDGLTTYLAARANVSVSGQPDPNRLPRIKGFRFLEYKDLVGTVEILFEQPDKSINGLTRNVVWLGENWLIALPAPKDNTVVLKAYVELPSDVEVLPQV